MSLAPRSAAAGLCAVALLAVLPAGDAAAQTGEPPTGPEFALSASVLAPLAELTSTPLFATEVSTAVGASATVAWWFGRHVGVTAQGVWAPGELNVRQSEFTGPVPTGLGDVRYLAGTAAFTYRLAASGALAVVEPYFGLGGGVRRLSFEPQASPDAEDATDPVGTVLAGAITRVGPSLSLRLEIRDLVSYYESPLDGEARLQNDVLVSVGVGLRP